MIRRLAARLCRAPASARAVRRGRRGERVAARWLRRRGYRILHRNLRVGHDEADLVALDPDGETIVVVEVKARADGTIAPEESVGPAKRRQMVRLAGRLQARGPHAGRPFRLDVIAVVCPDRGPTVVRHYVSAVEA